MLRSLAPSLLPLLLVALAPAQEHAPPKPGEEMERLHDLLGHWRGEGFAIAPGMGEIPWQSHEEMKLVLDGFFVEMRSEIEVGAPMPLQFLSLMGWDGENQRYVSYGLANNGEHQGLETMNWVDDDTLVLTSSKNKQGQPAVTRTTHRIEGEDAWSITVEEAVGAGPFQVVVQGDYVRVDKPHTFARETGFIGGAVPNEMRKLKRMVGDWGNEGWFDFPGMGRQPITGHELCSYGFGGHVMRTVTEGQAGDLPAWTGWTFMIWDAPANAYHAIQFSNMGEVNVAQMMWNAENPDELLGISAMRYMGQAMATRSVTTFDDGGLVGVTAHACVGTEEPKQNFAMKYVPRKQ